MIIVIVVVSCDWMICFFVSVFDSITNATKWVNFVHSKDDDEISFLQLFNKFLSSSSSSLHNNVANNNQWDYVCALSCLIYEAIEKINNFSLKCELNINVLVMIITSSCANCFVKNFSLR